MDEGKLDLLLKELRRLADATERLAGPAPAENDVTTADCFVWSPARNWLQPVPQPNRIALSLIRGVDRVRDILHERYLGGAWNIEDGTPFAHQVEMLTLLLAEYEAG